MHLVTSAEYVDRLLSEIESVLAAGATKSPFQKYNLDFSQAQSKVIQDYCARIRAQMVRLLEANAIQPERPQYGAIHTIRTNLTFVQIALEEMTPRYLRGYGEVPESLIPRLNGTVAELQGLVDKLDAYLAQRLGRELQDRLGKLDAAGHEVSILKTVEKLITKYGLVEYRPTISLILERMETSTFEIAVFGRVSSGKSSLLNYILSSEVLPVGVSPITSVPTRLIYGTRPTTTVWFSNARPQQFEVERLAEFVTEKHNPANQKRITRLVVELPLMEKYEGVVFVDTPGLGSLAALGTMETMAYLPQCDLGIVLINAGATIAQEDISTIQTLYEAGIPAMVLLSKADLLSQADRDSAARYIAGEIESQLGLKLSAHPVSVMKEHSSLLESWFEHEIVPLRARHKDLAQQSLHRKTAALVDSVAAVLRVKLGKKDRIPEGLKDRLNKAEANLRAVAGKFHEAREFYQEATGQIRELGPSALAKAASDIVDLWSIKGGPDTTVEGTIVTAITLAAAERARLTHAMLKHLAHELSRALEHAEAALGTGSSLAEAELAAGLKEIPRLDLGSLVIELRPSLYSFLGKKLARRGVARRIEMRLGSDIDLALHDYGSLFEAWARGALETLRGRFDSHADAYRAQFERLGRDRQEGARTDSEIEDDLGSLLGSDSGLAKRNPVSLDINHQSATQPDTLTAQIMAKQTLNSD